MEKVNPDNLKLLDDWNKYLVALSRSSQTIYNYNSDIKIFFVYLLKEAGNKFFGDIIERDIVFFQSWCMNDLKLSNNRIRRLKDVLSSFSNYVETFYKDDERLKDFKNITRVVPQPAKRKTLVETELTDSDVKLIFEKLIEDEKYNAACMLALALYGGLRKAEIPQIMTETFDKENIVLNHLYKTPNKIKLKGDREECVYFLKEEMDRYIYLWKRQRKRIFRKYGHPSDEMKEHLLINRYQGRWKLYTTESMTYFSELITNTMKEAGIEKAFYWEAARKYFVKLVNSKKLTDEQKKLLLKNM